MMDERRVSGETANRVECWQDDAKQSGSSPRTFVDGRHGISKIGKGHMSAQSAIRFNLKPGRLVACASMLVAQHAIAHLHRQRSAHLAPNDTPMDEGTHGATVFELIPLKNRDSTLRTGCSPGVPATLLHVIFNDRFKRKVYCRVSTIHSSQLP